MTTDTKDLLKQLEEAMNTITNSEEWKAILRTQARFHKYSFGNVILIQFQKPYATRVAGYKKWQELGRQVMKGEKGIKILAPLTYIMDKQNTETGEITRVPVLKGFRTVSVFDISQTKGDPIPSFSDLVQDITTSEYQESLGRLADVMRQEGLQVSFRPVEGGARGYYVPATKEVVINNTYAADSQLKTLIHEWAHHKLHNAQTNDKVSREQAEVEAESVAFVVSESLGLDTSCYSFGYVAGWAGGDAEVIRKAGERIQKAAQQIIDAILVNSEQPNEEAA